MFCPCYQVILSCGEVSWSIAMVTGMAVSILLPDRYSATNDLKKNTCGLILPQWIGVI
jgi:hypothetical protein